MNLGFLASFLLICAIISIAIHHSNRQMEVMDREFWEKERRANTVRKKSLDQLDYITIPEELLTMQPAVMTDDIASYLKDLQDLSQAKIVNLTGISNTDLKLTYGTSNITILSNYDFHYTNMVSILQKLAEALVRAEEKELAIRVLEFSISTGTDVGKSYYLLASLYREKNTLEKIEFLIQQANSLHTSRKDSIIRNLKQAQ